MSTSQLALNEQGASRPPLTIVAADGARAEPPQRHVYSRRIAVDIVGFMDVIGVLIGGVVPAAIYAMYGEMPDDDDDHDKEVEEEKDNLSIGTGGDEEIPLHPLE